MRKVSVAALAAGALSVAAATALVGGLTAVVGAAPAAAAPDATSASSRVRACAVTGFAPRSDAEDKALRTSLPKQPVTELRGTPLDRAGAWTVPDDGQPLIVVDSVKPMTRGKGDAVLFGQRFPIKSGSVSAGEARERYVSTSTMPHLGPTTRIIGLDLSSDTCAGTLVVRVDRGPLSTLVGRIALAASVLFAVLTVLLARRRADTWLRRALPAMPFGLLAGVGVAALCYEAGVASPFSRWPYALAVVGLGLAAGIAAIRQPEGKAFTAGFVAAVTLLALTPFALTDRAVESDEAATGPVTPESATIVVDRTIRGGQAGNQKLVKPEIKYVFDGYVRESLPRPESRLTRIMPGVPRGQSTFPAHFVASAELDLPNGKTSYLYSRYERAAADAPWTITWLSLFTSQMPAPRLDDAGYLAASPGAAQLLADPAVLSQKYTEWLTRVARSNALDTDPLFVQRAETSLLKLVATDGFVRENAAQTSTAYAPKVGAQVTAPVPLSDGTVHVVFSASTHVTIFNRPGNTTAACTPGIPYLEFGSDTPGRFRQLDQDLTVQVEAWVPVKSSDKKQITIEDWNIVSSNKTGVRC